MYTKSVNRLADIQTAIRSRLSLNLFRRSTTLLLGAMDQGKATSLRRSDLCSPMHILRWDVKSAKLYFM